jgi:hypothetical protein
MSTAFVITPSILTEPNQTPNAPLVYRGTFTAAQMTSAFTTPLLVLPPLTGYVYVPISAVFMKDDVTAFGNPQLFRVSYNNSNLSTTNLLFGTSVLTATTKSAYTVIAGNIGYIASGSGAAGDIGSVGLVLNVLVGNLTGGTSCTLAMTYQIYPIFASNFGQY